MKLLERVRSLWAQQDARSMMLLALVVWLCSLPVVFLMVTPFLGWQIASFVALGLLVFLLPICWGICWFRASR
jgi:hypothetical protein